VARLRAAGCVFAEEEAEVLLASAGSRDELERMVSLRAAGRPLEQVVGWAELCGVRVLVEPGVFVPRPRSELLVREAAGLLRARCALVDLCCGSAAVGLAVIGDRTDVELHAADVDPVAVACAERNVGGLGCVHCGDLFDALPGELRGRLDVVVANAPYVPTAELSTLPREARDHEAPIALDGGPDGLDVHRRIATDAPSWLSPDGVLLFEVAVEQAGEAERVLSEAGMGARIAIDWELEVAVAVGSRT
jgi:release factor glutamine methyltransferase